MHVRLAGGEYDGQTIEMPGTDMRLTYLMPDSSASKLDICSPGHPSPIRAVYSRVLVYEYECIRDGLPRYVLRA